MTLFNEFSSNLVRSSGEAMLEVHKDTVQCIFWNFVRASGEAILVTQ